MKKYIYFENGRCYYDGYVFQWKKLSSNKIPKKHLRYKIEDVLNGKYPKKIMDYLESILDDENISIFMFYLAQVFNNNFKYPIYFVGEPRTGKTVLKNFIYELLYPFVHKDKTFLFFKNKCHNYYNHVLYLKNKEFIIETNTYLKHGKNKNNRIITFKNIFNEHYTYDKQCDILSKLRDEYSGFIFYLLFRYEDFMDDVEGVLK